MEIRTYKYRDKKLFEVVATETNASIPITTHVQTDIELQDDLDQVSAIIAANESADCLNLSVA
ncbi:MAG: hypothetical protein ACLQPD_31950 [Desulfomonilaceae bacterium]